MSRHLSTRLMISFCSSCRTIRTIRQFKPARRHGRQAPTKWWVTHMFTHSFKHALKKRFDEPRTHAVRCNAHARTVKGPSMQASVCQGRVGCKFIMVRRADGTVLRGLCWDCGGPLINHTDVIGRWEPHGRCRAQRWPHPASPLRLTSDRDGERQRVGEGNEAGGVKG